MQSFPGELKMQDLKMSTKETAGLGLYTITCFLLRHAVHVDYSYL